MLQPWMIPSDLAPGDAKSARLDWAGFELHRIRSIDDPLFPIAFEPLWQEFDASNELEQPEVLADRMRWDPRSPTQGIALLYELLLVTRDGEFVAVRDHTAIVRPGTAMAVVHLSHNLVARPFRRSGIAGWLRALPIQTARNCLTAQGLSPASQVYLVGEMEPADPGNEARTVRLTAYGKAGYRKVDPSRISYLQPDFRPYAEIDASGSPQPVALDLLVRKVGRESETEIRAETVHGILASLYQMYAMEFRPQDMECIWAHLGQFPRGDERIALLPPHHAMTIRIFHDAAFEAPIGDHIMPIHKFRLVAEALRNNPLLEIIAPEPVTEEDLLRVHTSEYIRAIRTGEPRTLAESQKFPWSSELFPSVCLTNGGVYAAARTALDRGASAALASGFHHACRDHGEGFCTFNGLVVALEKLRIEGRIRRAAVLDMDLHYGNGTASLSGQRDWLFALSIYGNDYWENVPHRDVGVIHHPAGPNHAEAVLPNGCRGEEMLSILEKALPSLLDGGRPDLILYQAGADPLRDDPYSPLDLGHQDLLARDRRVFAFAKAEGIPIAWVLAGGYTKDTSQVVAVHTNTAQACIEVFSGSP